MKPVKLSDFEVNGSLARRIAEANWGKFGTKGYRTTKEGIYYYSCSRHGGYVADPKRLDKSLPYARMETLLIVVGVHHKTGEEYVLGTSTAHINLNQRRASIKYNPFKFTRPEWRDYPVACFEEDCNWAAIETLEGVRIPKAYPNADPEKLDQHRANTFAQLNTPKMS